MFSEIEFSRRPSSVATSIDASHSMVVPSFTLLMFAVFDWRSLA
jgi:hypothetical protein